MIRFVIGLFLFAVALCAYIVNLPDSSGPGAERMVPAMQPAVTSAGTDATAPLPTAVSLGSVVVTQPVRPYMTNSDPLELTIVNVLLGLGLDIARSGAMASRADGPQTRLEMMVLQALHTRSSDAEIDAQINDAALNNGLSVPDVLVRADGRIDAPALLNAIVQYVIVASGGSSPSVPPLTDHPMLVWQDGQARYRVIAADSLADIAQRFYGDISRTDMILVANPDVLSSADRIAPDQILVIPTL